jgi:hypothetical protein
MQTWSICAHSAEAGTPAHADVRAFKSMGPLYVASDLTNEIVAHLLVTLRHGIVCTANNLHEKLGAYLQANR